MKQQQKINVKKIMQLTRVLCKVKFFLFYNITVVLFYISFLLNSANSKIFTKLKPRKLYPKYVENFWFHLLKATKKLNRN